MSSDEKSPSESIRQSADAQDARAVRAFDIRTIVGVLLGIYGVVIFIMGLTASDADLEMDAGFNLNLWTGVALIVVSAGFLIWVRLRPLVVPRPGADADEAHLE
ncbi:hypothetical protein [Cellulomonas sp. PhB143]|uniref:hypothetical protein n=1 Tax=Cellulomonas sp. PhB143 TaxID=2485186 RepID=UPI000F46F6D3|nr:hypothetical protein [Cellulomonas sp. PhB143]ROS75392.1 hypothetical protein EDF32_1801 [Cellulomonas sp. PhB143]